MLNIVINTLYIKIVDFFESIIESTDLRILIMFINHYNNGNSNFLFVDVKEREYVGERVTKI